MFSRMVVDWRISESLRSDLAIDALEIAVWNRTRHGQVLDGAAITETPHSILKFPN